MTRTLTPRQLAAVLVPVSLLLVLWAGGCAQRSGAAVAAPAGPRTLQARLDEYEAQSRATAPERTKVFDQFIKQLCASDVAQRALTVGATAPDFQLPSDSGEQLRLNDVCARGPVVLLWYRGGWSPQCTVTLRAYQDALAELHELGAAVLAVSPQTPESSVETRELGGLGFDLLSDVGNQVARKYGLVYKLSPEAAIELGGSVNLREYNGDASGELPLTATYLVDTQGVIRYAFVDPDYRKRAEPATVIDAIQKLRGE